MCNKRFFGIFSVVFFFFASCGPTEGPENRSNKKSITQTTSFKLPLDPEYNKSWYVSQSWCSHCKGCNDHPDNPWGEYFCDDGSHCDVEVCNYGWDFSLPGAADKGKPVLASGNGIVKNIVKEGDAGYSSAEGKWGVHVVVDHEIVYKGKDLCTRYAHMQEGSVGHLRVGMSVCQGLVLGKIGDTGSPDNWHLHFQFEDCKTRKSIEKGFSEENSIPKCFDHPESTNTVIYDCDEGAATFSGGKLSKGGWYSADCGSLPGCPLIPNCGRETDHVFPDAGDDYFFGKGVAEAAAYLYSECALDGDANGELAPLRYLTRAEALKVPMFLYGLMDNCGASEPFADVDQDDWYFEVVACAIQHQIITFADYFRPNDNVRLDEAAKFVVEAASKAGVIQIQDPAQGHFSNIPKTYWAYKYLETLYYYGFPDKESLGEFPNRTATRGYYFVMVASFSPCYYRNVDCESGCPYDQSVFACVNPNDTSSGTGGGGDEEFVPDVSIECSVDSEDTQCVDPDTVLQIECDVTNNGDEVVKVTDLHLVMTDPTAASVCQVTDDAYRTNVGYNSVWPGETRRISGHFDITCLERPSDGGIDVSLDLTHTVVGPNLVFTDVAQTTIAVPRTPFADCYCNNRECGSDSNGGSCGYCGSDETCDYANGQCVCAPDCVGRECGSDSCGGSCGSCGSDETCDYTNGQCVPDCVPDCVGRECGSDSCGGSCGSCGLNETCNYANGQCVPDCVPNCVDSGNDDGDGCGNEVLDPGEMCDGGLDCDPDTCTCPANYTPDNYLGCLACGEPGTCNSPYCIDAPVCWVQEVRVALPSGGTVYIETGAGFYMSVSVPVGHYLRIGLLASDLGASFWCSTPDISVEAIKGTMYAWFPGVMYPQPFVGPGQLVSKFDLVNSPGSHANWRLL